MQCSNCSTRIKPIVAIDIDGTLGKFHGHFQDFAVCYLGITRAYSQSITHYDGSNSFRDWFCEMYNIKESTWYDIKLAYRQGGMKRTMPPYGAPAQLVEYVRGQGAEVWITTTRPYNRLDNIDPDTQEWCRRNDIVPDYMLYDEDKYSILAERVDPARVVAVYDDLGEMYDAAFIHFGPDVPILAKSLWNRGVRRQFEAPVDNLRSQARMIGHRIMDWKKVNDRPEEPMFPLPQRDFPS